MTASPSGEPGPGSSFARRLAWGVAAFDLLILVFALWTLAWSRHQHIRRAEMTTHNLAQILEQNLLGMVNQIDLALLTVKDEVERQEATRLEPRVQEAIRAQIARVPILDSLRTVDARGFVNHDPGPAASQRVDVQDRDYFQHLKVHPDPGLFISRPALGRINGKWVVFFARRLNQAEGQFAGVVYGTVTIDRLVNTLSEVDVGRKGSVSLRGASHELLARFPRSPQGDQSIGDPHIEGGYLEAVQSGRSVSHFTAASRIDGQVRTYTLRKMTGPGFLILVGLSEGEYLQSWRREAFLSGSAVLGLLTLSLAIAWMAHSTWTRHLAAQTERDQLIKELTQALAEVKSLEGMLPICGHCKKIRDDQGYWNHLESYISKHSDATFSHGVCPDCAQELRREMQARREQRDPS